MTTAHAPAGELLAHAGDRRIDLLADAFVVDDRSLIDNPAEILLSVELAREERRCVAVEHVGSSPESLSLLPLIEPDVIVLAPHLSESEPDSVALRALHVLAAQAERTGAVIVASGVDSELHRTRALALGATLGIGEMFPPIDTRFEISTSVPVGPTWSTPTADSSSPFEIASARTASTVSTKALLVELSIQIEAQASSAGADTLALGTFQHALHFGAGTRRRWQAMAERIAYTGVYGTDMLDATELGVIHSGIDRGDPLVDEWNVVVLGQFFCCVLSARDLHRGEPEPNREFAYVVSHDRGTVVRCARAVLSRFHSRSRPSEE